MSDVEGRDWGGKSSCQPNTPLKGNTMYKSINPHRRTGAVLAILLFAGLASAPASASVTDDPTNSYQYCPLTRIGTQLVRCDNLTGAGVPAPFWIPEQ
jgi:hypothetical protein